MKDRSISVPDNTGAKKMNRRCFVCGSVALVAGGLASPSALIGQTLTQTRAVVDPNILLETVIYASGNDSITAYLARPKKKGKYPGVVVIPGNWIVEPYIVETAAMLAQKGFVGLAVDVFPFFPRVATYDGITDEQWDASGALVRKEYSEERVSRIVNDGIDLLKTREFVNKKRFGAMGFCGGGWGALYSATRNPEIAAVAPFYAPPNLKVQSDLPVGSRPTPMEFVAKIKVPVQGHYGTKDRGIPIEDVEKFEAALKAQKTPVEIFYYETVHGFFAYNRDGAYHPAAAKLAFDRTTRFFTKYLK